MSAQSAPEPQPTSTGLDARVASLLAYLLGWLSGLVLYLVETQNREVRFHAAQSVLLSLALLAIYVALFVLGFVPVIGFIAFLASLAVGLGALGLWVYMLVQAWNLTHVRLPVIGDMAERWAAR